ncbi:40S ribosomal protein S20-2 [Tanacetum coccineum]
MPSYNNQQSFYQSPTGLYRPTMDSSTSSQANQPYSPLNRVTLDMDFEQLMYSQEYYPTQDYFMGQGSAHGSVHSSAPVDDNDSPVEEMSPVKAKKPSKCASKAKKNDTKKKESPKDWTTTEEIALCRAWCDVSKNSEKGYEYKLMYKHDFTLEACWNILKGHQGWLEVEMPSFYQNTKGRKKSKTSETTSGSASGGFNLNNEADESEEETQEHRPIGRDRSKAKKKSSASSREGSSSFVEHIATRLL